jgi:protein-disulfide isomerase
LAAEAALAAGAQGKFWEMHDLLFTNQKALKMTDLISYAKTLGLDIKKFQKSLDSREFQKQVETDMAFGKMLRVTATPTFFVNGNKITGAKAYPEFKNMIETLLAGKELPKVQEPNKETPAALVTDLKPDLSGTLNAKGVETAPVTIVEYSDFQCPFCGRVVPSLDKLFKAYPDKIRIIFKQYPLSFHANARPAAKAALAAGRQGKFWEMHDLLFANQTALSDANYLAWAKQLNLDLDQFKKDLSDPALETQIAADEKEARGFGISGTPSFVINGTKYVGAYPYERFEQIIKAELEKK